ncbi:MAG: hypothetical protein ACRDZR_02180 [Acidimicrobiales bacterium]
MSDLDDLSAELRRLRADLDAFAAGSVADAGPCPPWCEVEHGPLDRDHHGPPVAAADVQVHPARYAGVGARVVVYAPDDTFVLAPADARRVAHLLVAGAALVEAGAGTRGVA